MSQSSSQGSVSSGFKIMTVNRGWSLEADKLLDFVVRYRQLCQGLIINKLP
jgi:hypothetical protein